MEKDIIINQAACDVEADLGIDKERAREIIIEFIKTLPLQLEKIEESLSNTELLQELAHTIKGTSANLRMNGLYEASKALDAAAKSGTTELYKELVSRLSEEVRILSS